VGDIAAAALDAAASHGWAAQLASGNYPAARTAQLSLAQATLRAGCSALAPASERIAFMVGLALFTTLFCSQNTFN
jgi:hypothetical protein